MPENSLVLQLLCQSALVPALVALAVLAASRALRLNAVAAVAAAFIASYAATLHAQWSLVPHVALDWMPWIAVGAAGAALAVERSSGAARPALRLVVGLVIAAVVASGALASLGVAKTAVAVVVAGAVIAAVWSAFGAAPEGGARHPLLLAVVAGGTGLALMLDSSQQIGQLSGALAVALGVCMLVNLPRTRVAFPPAASGVAVLLLGALILNAYLYAGFSLGYVVLLVIALLADSLLAAGVRLRGRTLHPTSWIPAAVLTVIPVAATIAMVLKAAQEHGGY
ncbi:hypothetical protein GCM10028796_46100 [Ramlibacter monticola]|uniref:Uncharacterized protein n=1 Tax=Ramlibacter monticola TaxID=1926872 RepID=A0A936Z420_9BURK|nr:hypothetical protein [Ramlibacter monticola]MBL0393220.1 hypothetical protein [Ramlibacter monticola]